MSDINLNHIRFYLLGIFITIFGALILFIRSPYYTKKEYLRYHNKAFQTVVYKKYDEHPVRSNKISLKNQAPLRIPRPLFDQLQVGDSVRKQQGSDTIIFKTQSGNIHYDYYKHLRENEQRTHP